MTLLAVTRATRRLTAHIIRDVPPALSHVFDQLPAALVVHQESRLIALSNAGAALLTQWTRDELHGRPLAELLAVPQPEAILNLVGALPPVNSGPVLHAVTLRKRSAESAIVDLRLSCFDDPAGRLVLLQLLPIDVRLLHERRTAQHARSMNALDRLSALLHQPRPEALGAAVELVRDMLAAPAAGFYVLKPTSTELRLLHASHVPPRFPQVIDPDDVPQLNTPWVWETSQHDEFGLFNAARAAGWTRLIAHPVGDPEIVGALFVGYSDPRLIPHEAPTLLALAARQVGHLVELIAREKALADMRDLSLQLSGRLAAASAAVAEGLLTLGANTDIEDANLALGDMLGFRPDDMIGLPVGDVLFAEESLAEQLHLSLGTGRPISLKGELRRRSGEAFPAELRLLPLPQCGCLLVVQDLSEARAAEQRLENLGQMARVGQELQAFAHEARHPLNNITAGLQYLASRSDADDQWRHQSNIMLDESMRLDDLLKGVVEWAKPLEAKLAPTDLPALMQRVITRYKPKMSKQNVRLANIAIPEAYPLIMGDAHRLEQVFSNLVQNALQAMPAGGHLALSVRTLDRGSLGTMLEVRVSDSGPGMTDEVRRRIFDPNFTTKAGGTGLGLAICRRLMTTHHGGITCESYLGVGTIFVLTFPALLSPARPAAPLKEVNP